MRAGRLIREAYKIGKQEGVQSLASASARYFRENIGPSYWKGKFKDQLEVECDGVSVIFDTTKPLTKRWFYPRYINGQLHEPAFTHRLLESLREDSTFYDIGANVGYFTIFASEVCVNGEVHSFELDDKFVEAIKASLRTNGTSAKVVKKAVSGESGERVSFTDNTVPNITNSKQEMRTAETITLDKYLQSHSPPNVMKIDVEGFEYEVLQGAQDTLADDNMHTLFVEVHPEKLKQFGHDQRGVLSILDELGYEYRAFNDHRSADSALSREVNIGEIESNTMLECKK